MLVGVVSAVGRQGTDDVIDRVSLTVGARPVTSRRVGDGVVAGWEGPGGIPHRSEPGWMAEGRLELGDIQICPSSMDTTKGDFALVALYGHGLLLGSGRAGGYRPIYVTKPSSGLVVASTRLAPLLSLLPKRPLNAEYLSATLLGRSPPGDATPYTNVARVPFGEAWLAYPGAPARRWSILKPPHDPELRDDGGLPHLLRHAITDAVCRAAQPATRAGVEVSGGLDSSLILSLLESLARAGRVATGPLGISYECAAPRWNDDRPYLRSLEDYLGSPIRRVLPQEAAPFIHQPMTIDAMPAPSPILVTVNPIGQIVRGAGAKVVLSGDGGDQVLDGTPSVFGELARRGEILRALDGSLRTRGVFYQGPAGRLARFLVRPLVEPLLPRVALDGLRRLRRGRPGWAGRALVHAGIEGGSSPRFAVLKESPGERYTRMLREIRFVPWSLLRHQKEVLGGYAVRAPLLDDQFLRFVVTLPPLSLLQGGYLRGLMREAMRTLVPEDLRLRETKGSWHWFVEQTLERVGGLRALSGLAGVGRLADLRLVDPGAFRKVFEDGCRTPRHADYDELWRVLSAESFLRQYDENSVGLT
jgi:asparagine synthase (glutamine-hydrolysing)